MNIRLSFALFLFLMISQARAQSTYLVREISNLIQVSSAINAPVDNNECQTFLPVNELNEIGRHQTREVPACFRVNKDPRPFSGNLEPGQHRLMTQDNYPRKSGPLAGWPRGNQTGNYLLRRTADVEGKPNYEVVMNVNFTGEATLTSFMKDKTKDCFRQLAPYMKGPNGENLRVRILSPSETAAMDYPKPTAIPISVTARESTFRGNAGSFGSNFTCSTITHEFLHHLGLCDEYHEGVINDAQTGVNADWSCRAVTAEPNIMRNKEFSYSTTLPLTSRCECDANCDGIMKSSDPKIKSIYLSMNGYDVIADESSMWGKHCFEDPADSILVPANEIPDRALASAGDSDGKSYFNSYSVVKNYDNTFMIWKKKIYCQCPPGHPYCGRLLDNIKERASAPIQRAVCPPGLKSHDREPSIGSQGESRVETDGDRKVLIVSTPGSGRSLLKPQHFYKILAGNCEGGAPSYEACAPYATMPAGEMCNTMPAFCHDDEIYLNGPQGTPVARPNRRRR